ncbi:hypothetical protein [Stackebrandtia soli]|uniref:hypothetical protein n=1 Tax=Stackebrandtia soli TaxID=1892856 RepID=UPI0039EBACD7
MRLTDRDVECLTEWAHEDRESRIAGVVLIPVAAALGVVVCLLGPIEQWWALVVLPISAALLLFAVVTVFDGIRRFFLGEGSPERILAGRAPVAHVEAVVRFADGDEPTPISVELGVPIRGHTRYLHVERTLGLARGDRVLVVGFGSSRHPFRGMQLIVTETDERHWLRVSLSRDERHREPEVG